MKLELCQTSYMFKWEPKTEQSDIMKGLFTEPSAHCVSGKNVNIKNYVLV